MTSAVLKFELQERKDAVRCIRPSLDVIEAVVATAATGKALRVPCPEGWTLDKLRGWFTGTPMRYAERRGLMVRTRVDKVRGCLFVWAIKRAQGNRDALDEG